MAKGYHAHLELMAILASPDAYKKACEIYEVFSGTNSIVILAKTMKSSTLAAGGEIGGFLKLVYELRSAFYDDLGATDVVPSQRQERPTA
jgi:hypothetical protein